MKKAGLILLRHAKSDWGSGARNDFDRPLAARGRKDAPRMGKWMRKNGFIPDLILCSPALRARETLAAVNNELKVRDKAIIYEDGIYGASLDVLLGLIRKYNRRYGNIMITGHNPGIDELLCFLCKTPPPVTETRKLMTTAAVAVLEFEDTGFMTAAESGELLRLIRPAELPDII